MKSVVALLALLVIGQAVADEVFNSPEYNLSFRYPDKWSPRKPQLQTTVVLLYADDGSGATCNVTVGSRSKKLVGKSERELDERRRIDHSREYFVTRLDEGHDGFDAIEYWRGRLGQKEAGFLEFQHDLYYNEERFRYLTFIGSTYANEQRVTLLCNGFVKRRASIKAAFDQIRNSLFFAH